MEKKQQVAARTRSSGTTLLRLVLVVGRSAADLVAPRWSVTITSLSISKFLFGDLAFLLSFFFLRSFLRRGLAPYFNFIGGISLADFAARF
jgi:hypothetical protein